MRLEKADVIAACRSSLLPCIRIRPDAEKAAGPADSKFGGEFCLPAGTDAPEMELLAQINLAQVPCLKGFPQKGLLQFFLCTDEERFESFTEDDCAWRMDAGFFKVVYYPEVPEDAPACKNRVPENRWQMDSPTGGMAFETAEEIATLSFDPDGGLALDLGFASLADKLLPVFQAAWAEDEEDDEDDEDGGEDEEDVYALDVCSDTDQFARDFGNWGFKLGGHPALRQGDIRLEDSSYAAYSVLLFQYDLTVPDPNDPLDLEKDTFCFFIKPEDLKACRFDDLLMVYHNCF